MNATLTSANQNLLACPFCGQAAAVHEMRYINTGRLYGYQIKCGGCDLEIKEQPACWLAGKENEEMLNARISLVTRWNTRHASSEETSRKTKKMKALPKTLYIRREVDGNNSYLVAEETMRDQSDLAEKRVVGEYKLVQTLEVTAEVKAVKK